MSNQGWGNQPNQGWNNQSNQQGWGNQPQQQGWGNQPQQQGFQQQGFNQGFQQQGWNNQQHGHHHGHHHGHQNQFLPAQNQLYKFCSGLNHKFVLDVSQNHQDWNQLIIYTDKGVNNQKFKIVSVGNGKYAIFCAHNNLTMEVKDTNNGSRVHCSQPNKQANEMWELIPVTDNKAFKGKNAFYLKSCSGRVLDVSEGKAKDEQHVIQWDYNGGNNQIWVIEPTY